MKRNYYLLTLCILLGFVSFAQSPGGESTNMTAWFTAGDQTFSDAGTTNAANGAAVQEWHDKSGNTAFSGNHPNRTTALNKPTFNNAVINFNPAVTFDGNDDLRTPSNITSNDLRDVSNGLVSAYVVANSNVSNDDVFFDHGGLNAFNTIMTATRLGLGHANVDFNSDVNSEFKIVTGIRSGSDLEAFLNGYTNIPLSTTVTGNSNSITQGFRLGENTAGGDNLNGNLAEVIIYNVAHDQTTKERIQSFLALKYGITLVHSLRASDGSVIFNVATAPSYNNGIVGLSRDDASGLNQKVSASNTSGSILTLALDADFSSANNDPSRTTTHANDLQFLILGHNGGATTMQTTEIPSVVYTNRVTREWRVQKTANFTQNFNMKFDGFDDSYVLIKNTTGDFSSTVDIVGSLNASGEITTTLNDGDYFTLAIQSAAYNEVVEDIAGNSNGTAATAAQINSIDGVSGAVDGVDYTDALASGTYVDSSNPTAAEIQAVIDAENAAVAAYNEVVEDIAGNSNGTAATAAQINSIDGVSGAVDGVDYTDALASGTYVDSSNPTAAELQAVVDAENAAVAAYNEVVEDIAGNSNGTAATAAQINSIDGVSGAVDGVDYTDALASGTYVDSSNPTAAEIQAAVDTENAAIAAYNEVVEDIAGNSNGTAATAAQINSIDGVSGAVDGVDYTDALASGTYVDSSNPTAAEIQAAVDTENAAIAAYNEVVEDIAGNSNGTAATAAQINSIDGVSGAVDGVDYTDALANGTYVDSSNPTAAELQAVIDVENAAVAAYNEVVEDIAGNSNGTAATAAQINSIDGVSGAVDGVDYTDALANGTYVDSSNPTAAELQAVIDAENAAVAAYNEVVEDIAGNSNGTAATAAQINSIDGVSGAVDGVDYTDALANGTYVDSSNPTAAELQAVIDVENAAVAAYNEVVEDIAGNSNGTAATAAQINSIDGVSGAVDGVDYTNALANGTYVDSSNPTAAEIQAAVDAENAAVAAYNEVVEDIAGNSNGTAATAAQINSIDGVSGAVDGVDYTDALASGTYVDSSNPTAAELQAVVDAENAAVAAYNEVVEDIAGNSNGTAATAAQINSIDGVSGAVDGVDYTDALASGTYVDSSNPTAAEIQAVIDAENAAVAAYNEVVEDIAGNSNGTAATAAQINSIDGVSGAVDGVDYTDALASGTYVDSSNPTAAELQAVVDAENAAVAAYNEVVEDIAGNSNGTAATAAQINSIDGVSGAVDGVDYTDALASGTYVDSSNPTAAELQAVIDAENAAVAAYNEVVEDIAGNSNGTAATAAQINSIDGVSGAVDGVDYTDALASGTYVDSSNPTAAELQAVVDAENAAVAAYNEVVEDIAGNSNGTAATAAQINSIDGVSGAVDGVDYTDALANGTYVDSSNPTAAELQAVVDAANNTLSIEDLEKLQIVVYPNPVSEILNISSAVTIEKIEIYNAIGQYIYGRKENNALSLNVDVSNYQSGHYILKIVTDKQATFKKFVVKK